jgi:hypothetical protein
VILFILYIFYTIWCSAEDVEISNLHVGFEVLAAVVMYVAIFWDMSPCISYANRRFGGAWPFAALWLLPRLIFDPEDGDDTFLQNVCLHRIAWRYIPEDGKVLTYMLLSQAAILKKISEVQDERKERLCRNKDEIELRNAMNTRMRAVSELMKLQSLE